MSFPLRSIFVIVVAACMTWPLAVRGQTTLSIDLPLGPYYKPGKYIPVHMTAQIAEPGEKWVVVGSENATGAKDIGLGSIRTGVSVKTGRLDAVVPFLVTDGRVGRPRIFVEYRPETALAPAIRAIDPAAERLVGWTTPDEPAARSLLGLKEGAGQPTIIPVQLDPATPIRGHPAAWEALDLLMLDGDSAARLKNEELSAIVACGVVVTVRGPAAPGQFSTWPWVRSGEYWVLRHDPIGPVGGGPAQVVGSDGFPAVMRPVMSWEPGWPWPFRRKVLIGAAVYGLLMVGLAVFRLPLTWLWASGLTAGALVLASYWWEAQLLIQMAGGEVIVRTDALTQTDGWIYQTTGETRDATIRWIDVTHPILASRRAMDETWQTLNCDTGGTPLYFLTKIPARAKVAFVSRSVGPRAPLTKPATPVTSALSLLAGELYTADGKGQIAGELPGSVTASPQWGYLEVKQWNALVVDRRAGR